MYLHILKLYKISNRDGFLGGTRLDICATCDDHDDKYICGCNYYNDRTRTKDLYVCDKYIPKLEYYP